jgi:hypothetical protein
LEHRTLKLGTGLIDLLPPPDNLDVVPIGPARNTLALHIRRDERLSFSPTAPTHTDVPIGSACFHALSIRLQLDVVKYLDGYRIELIERGPR